MLSLSTPLSAILLLSTAAVLAAAEQPAKIRVYVGTYSGPKSKGIYLMEMDPKTGKLSTPELAGAAVNPSFLAFAPSKRFLYAVSEVSDTNGKKTGGVSAFAVDAATGHLTLLNQQPSRGAGPCHLVVDHAGKNVLVANYSGGSVAAIPIDGDGKLQPPTGFVQHKGASADPKRQQEPHAHSINLDAAGRFAIAADLGLDRLLVYKFDGAAGTLTPNDPPSAATAPKAGPRHFTFDRQGKFGYVINELDNTVTAFRYDADHGSFKEIQVISTLPEGVNGPSYTAEVVMHPTGRFLYGSNRGHDSIAILKVDSETGKLTAVGHEPTQGKFPRNFNIDPNGRFLLAANQDSNNIVVFGIDSETGKLTPTGQKITVPTPVCIKFVPVGS
jgi:6-phosphogluconolactonase